MKNARNLALAAALARRGRREPEKSKEIQSTDLCPLCGEMWRDHERRCRRIVRVGESGEVFRCRGYGVKGSTPFYCEDCAREVANG